MLNIKNMWFILADESFKFRNIPVKCFNVKILVFIDQNHKMYILIPLLINKNYMIIFNKILHAEKS